MYDDNKADNVKPNTEKTTITYLTVSQDTCMKRHTDTL